MTHWDSLRPVGVRREGYVYTLVKLGDGEKGAIWEFVKVS